MNNCTTARTAAAANEQRACANYVMSGATCRAPRDDELNDYRYVNVTRDAITDKVEFNTVDFVESQQSRPYRQQI